MLTLRVLIITAAFTGNGHMSLTDSIRDALLKREGVEVDVLDGFSLMGKTALRASKLYGPMTRHVRGELWRVAFETTHTYPGLTVDVMEELLAPRLYRELVRRPPNVILSVHPMFNGPVLNALERFGFHIPMCTLIADLVDIHTMWMDKRVARMFCPTEEAYRAAAQHGVPEDRLVRCTLPVRTRFLKRAPGPEPRDFDTSRPLRCLIMSGGEGSGNMRRAAEILLKAFNVQVTLVCGRNQKLHDTLSAAFEEYDERVHVLGFVTAIEDLMANSDFIVLRGSPNTLMEAVFMGLPAIITGALPGQEHNNPYWAERNGLAVYCPNLMNLRATFKKLIADDGAQLRAIRANQLAFRDFEAADGIAGALLDSAQRPPRSADRNGAPLSAPQRARRAIRRVKTRGEALKRQAVRLKDNVVRWPENGIKDGRR